MSASPLLEGSSAIHDKSQRPLSWLPEWAIHPDVHSILDKWHGEGTPKTIPSTITSGPALPLVISGFMMLWSFYILCPIFMWKWASYCDTTEGGVAQVHPWPWMMFFAILTIALVLEWRCLKYVIVPQMQQVKKVLVACCRVDLFCSYGFFATCLVMLSILSHMDIMTNNMFMIKVVKTATCPQGPLFDDIWAKVLQNSVFGIIPGISLVHFQYIVVVAWLLMLPQFVWSIMASVPLNPFAVSYTVSDDRSSVFSYSTILDTGTNHGAAFQSAATGARMAAVTYLDDSYVPAKMRYHLEGRYSSEWRVKYLQLLRHAISKGLFTFLCVGVLECGLQLNLQISLLGMNKAISKKETGTGNIDMETFVSIVFSLLTALKKLIDAKRLYSLRVTMMLRMHELTSGEKDSEEQKKIQALIRVINKRYLRLSVYVVAYVFLVGYAAIKLYYTYQCPEGLWNVGGCVVVFDQNA
eukprot:TRINITY_DN56226_c0_g1_i1.p1 TRINITY_DN56226_c0_g1~~TRINITY_DN56226_c0_g1_i1.p1  ORF type:complete len:486 (-),score=52.05 TRINITY_DN56226_c0_g1_i1:194-1597(-)